MHHFIPQPSDSTILIYRAIHISVSENPLESTVLVERSVPQPSECSSLYLSLQILLGLVEQSSPHPSTVLVERSVPQPFRMHSVLSRYLNHEILSPGLAEQSTPLETALPSRRGPCLAQPPSITAHKATKNGDIPGVVWLNG